MSTPLPPHLSVVPHPDPTRASLSRVPPHDLSAEDALVSAVLLDQRVIPRIAGIAPLEAYYGPSNRVILEAAMALVDEGTPVDAATVGAWLKAKGRLEKAGGLGNLARVVDAVPSVANVEAYAHIVREHWRTRDVIALAQRIAAEGYGVVEDRAAWLRDIPGAFLPLARDNRGRGPVRVEKLAGTVFEDMKRAEEAGGQIDVTPTGFVDLDAIIGGFGRGEVVVLAARPGMGKSALLGSFCLNAARAGEATLLFSLEMQDTRIVRRIVCGEANVPLQAAKTGKISQYEWSRLAATVAGYRGVPFSIYDVPCSLSEMTAVIHAHAAELASGGQRLGIVAVDYVQLIEVASTRGTTREQEVAKLARAMKLLAKELGICVIELSQLNRKCEEREDKRPNLSDLRESGAIEQDADKVIFIYRDEVYEPKHDGDERTCPHLGPDCNRGRAEVIVAKHRDGPVGTAPLKFEAARACFYNAPGEWDFAAGGAQ